MKTSNIRSERERLHLTELQASKLAGVHLTTWRRYEYGYTYPRKKTIEVLKKNGFVIGEVYDSLSHGATGSGSSEEKYELAFVAKFERCRLRISLHAASFLFDCSPHALEDIESGSRLPDSSLVFKMLLLGYEIEEQLDELVGLNVIYAIQECDYRILRFFRRLDDSGRQRLLSNIELYGLQRSTGKFTYQRDSVIDKIIVSTMIEGL